MIAASARMSGTSAPDSSSLKCGCSASLSSRARAAAVVVGRLRAVRETRAFRRELALVAAAAVVVFLVVAVEDATPLFRLAVAASRFAGTANPAISVKRQSNRRHG